MKGWRR